MRWFVKVMGESNSRNRLKSDIRSRRCVTWRRDSLQWLLTFDSVFPSSGSISSFHFSSFILDLFFIRLWFLEFSMFIRLFHIPSIPFIAIHFGHWEILYCLFEILLPDTFVILIDSIPFHSIPFHSIPFHSIPFHSIPFHSIPFHSIPFHSIYSLHFARINGVRDIEPFTTGDVAICSGRRRPLAVLWSFPTANLNILKTLYNYYIHPPVGWFEVPIALYMKILFRGLWPAFCHHWITGRMEWCHWEWYHDLRPRPDQLHYRGIQ